MPQVAVCGQSRLPAAARSLASKLPGKCPEVQKQFVLFLEVRPDIDRILAEHAARFEDKISVQPDVRNCREPIEDQPRFSPAFFVAELATIYELASIQVPAGSGIESTECAECARDGTGYDCRPPQKIGQISRLEPMAGRQFGEFPSAAKVLDAGSGSAGMNALRHFIRCAGSTGGGRISGLH